MSTDFQTFEQSLADVDVSVVHVPLMDVAAAIADFSTESTVGVPLDRDEINLPDSVTVDPTPAALKDATTGVTPAAFAIADYGSLVVPSTDSGSQLVSLFVDRHVVILDEVDIVPNMETAFERFEETLPDDYNDGIIATGPSATADMGALVKGAHGPSEVCVVVVEE
jgi:L-lactate dehydrogenase complex protein LldG